MVVVGFTVVTTGGRSGDVGVSGKPDEAPENNEKVNVSLSPKNVFYRSV